ncbi:hypothetical protein FNW02_30670 [Komarekiella sp. 'clone 1']|uniref:YopA central domain-containing protein n=1 Tax=Komarekiella delphini-convector SJRDD-AB1 TaxID=2593771 RepID=A0AA40T346_9NOST|nr:hypothetical protein [Komarekiella delphini-convector]MBD6620044.1 hypothetical protein [Komarekiella delphini-convector SJRDD-AB1]
MSIEDFKSLLNQYLPAIVSSYQTSEANHDIQLYEGLLEIIQGETVYQGKGSVVFKWLPSPDIKFDFSTQASFPHRLNFDQTYLKFLETRAKVNILSLPTIFDENLEILGCLSEPVELNSNADLFSVNFHLTNFHNFRGTQISRSNSISSDRLILEAEGWRICIDNVENLEYIIKSLKLEGGYAITHVGKLERFDKKTFSSKEAEEILEVLHWFLSFCRGFRISPILLVGQNSRGKKVWEKWHSNQLISPWKGVNSWFIDSTALNTQSMNEFFAGFLTLWQTNTWNDSIRLAIHWYLESNAQAGAVQGSIILLQAAFELLAGTLLVEDKKKITQEEFDNTRKYPATEKLKYLLLECGISLDIPETLTDLLKAAEELKWNNGVQALTETRNALIHANPKKRKRLLNRSFYEKIDIVNLGLWYLELVLLNIFGYKGKYLSRVTRKKIEYENIQTVPWA